MHQLTHYTAAVSGTPMDTRHGRSGRGDCGATEQWPKESQFTHMAFLVNEGFQNHRENTAGGGEELSKYLFNLEIYFFVVVELHNCEM